MREAGRSFWPEKLPETLPATEGERKLEEREALGEDQLRVRLVDEDSMRVAVVVVVVGKKCEAMVATSIAALCREKECVMVCAEENGYWLLCDFGLERALGWVVFCESWSVPL